jgi:hypothetical protein
MVTGVVMAEAGRLGTPSLIAIGDASGGIVVRVPEESSAPARGTLVTVTGPLAAPYGQLEIRPEGAGLRVLGYASAAITIVVEASDLGEDTEGRLASIVGTLTASPRKSTSNDLTIDLVDKAGRPFRALADASSGLVPTDLVKGSTCRLVGIVGQRASKKGALDGYRVWLRDRSDVEAVPGGPSGSSTSTSGASTVPILTIAAARRLDDAPAVIEGVVTAGAGLLDSDGRRIVIQDTTGGIEVYLPGDAPAPAIGTRLRVAGTVGRAWDAPRLRATAVTILGPGVTVVPLSLRGAPGAAVEWQLVRIAGTITDVTRLGDRWRADVRVGTHTILVTGLSGAGIASTTLIEGRAVTVVGIVRRPYPTATDRRWTVIPRAPWDLAVGPAGGGRSTGGGIDKGSGGASGAASGGSTGLYATVSLIDLATLDDHVGEIVRIGGLVVARMHGGFTLDDGTAVAKVVLNGEAAAFLELIDAGDALGIVGRVEAGDGGELVIMASDPSGLVRLGSLGETVPLAAAATSVPSPEPAAGAVASAGLASPFEGLSGGALGGLGLLLASACSVIVTVVRRRRDRRRLATAVASRLAELRHPSGSA